MYRYKVKRGDSPLTVAARFGLSPQSLLSANPGVNEFATGMTVKVPQLSTGGGYQGWRTGSAVPKNGTGFFQGVGNILRGGTWNGQTDLSGMVNAGVGPNSAYGHNYYGTGVGNAGVQGSYGETEIARRMKQLQGYNPSAVQPAGGENRGGSVQRAEAGAGAVPGSFGATPLYPFLDQIATATGQAVQAVGQSFQTGGGGNYPGIPGNPNFINPSQRNLVPSPMIGESQRGEIFKPTTLTNTATSDLNYQIQDPAQIKQLINNGQPVTMQQAQLIGYTPEQIQYGVAKGTVIADNASAYPEAPQSGSQFSTDRYGRRVETYANGTAQRVGNFFGASGDKWRTYVNDQGQLVTTSTVDYKRRPGYRHYGGGGNITGSGVTGFGLVNFGVGTG